MKRVHDVVASELDFIRLTERLERERSMSTEMTEDAKLEVDLRLSLFRNGFDYAMTEQSGWETSRQIAQHREAMSDADYACGYSTGSTCREQALSQYRQALLGGGK